MEKTEGKQKRFGLVGKNIGYSFSKGYFSNKFKELGLFNHSYENFDLFEIGEIEEVFKKNQLVGLNVTIPYKEKIIPYLKKIDPIAAKIGAVNTIQLTKEGPVGYNTDAYGFKKALQPHLRPHHKNALILGTGGASKAIAYILTELGIAYTYVSRNANGPILGYQDISGAVVNANELIVNCTPLGTHPNIADRPEIPYHSLGPKHLLFDLIYNPDKTSFLQLGEAQGAQILNGLEMLEQQAEKAWSIWQDGLIEE